MIEHPMISVVICCYTEDRWDRLMAAVESARGQRPHPREVVVVVDHNPRLLRRLEGRFWASEVVRIVANRESAGLSGARNTGLAEVTSPVVAFLDDDAVAAPGWLAAHAAAYDDNDVIGVGGQVDPDWETGRPGWFPHDFDWVVGCTHTGVPDGTIRNPIGANMSFRTDALRAVGGFSHRLGRVGTLPLGCEETEASIRVGRHHPGSRVVSVPAARVDHFVGRERGTFAYYRRRCLAEGRSKAYVKELAPEPLETERAYATRVLPRSAAANLRAGVRGDRDSLSRAGAIAAGLTFTVWGYLGARVRVAVDRG